MQTVKFEERSLPKTFIIELTKRCNNRCLYCYAVWGTDCEDIDCGQKPEMSTEEIKQIISKLQVEVGAENIGLSGGEPLLRNDLPEILSFIKNLGLNSVVITNGTLLTQEKAEETADAGLFEVTLLSFREEVHDRLAGRRGAWDAAWRGMTNIKKSGGNFVSVFVATKLNYMDLKNTAKLSIALGASGLMYNRINLGSHNICHADQLLPTPEMIRQNLDDLEEIGKEFDLPIAASVVIEPCVVDIGKYEHIQFGWCPLAGENSYFTIDPTGDIRICNHSPSILGNITRDRFIDIYKMHPYVRSFHDTWPEECHSCNHQLKDICRGGCKAAAEQCYGTLDRVDPFVTLSKLQS